MHKHDGLEWQMSAESQAVHEEMVAVSRHYEGLGQHVPKEEKQALDKKKKMVAKKDCEAWMDEQC